MSANTVLENQQMGLFDDHDAVWLFGYGSLIYKVDFPYLERQAASIKHWERRFWQGSHDHRGTLEAPGRVVTLIKRDSAICDGMAYLISPDVFDHLDFREKNGYLRFSTEMTFKDQSTSDGVVYIATEENKAFLGPASEQSIARHIAASVGPSGSNKEYLTQLAESLRELSAHDAHVFSIEKHLKRI